jgi:histidinol-phosphate aminotransferase
MTKIKKIRKPKSEARSKFGLAKLVRPLVRQLHPYVPGEQPKIKGLIKLNTNENPYSPSPKVLRAVKAATDGRLRLYPNPTSQKLREALAKFHHCDTENIIVGNGSDELLAMAVRCFVEPAIGDRESASIVQYFTPSYSLYPVLADTHGARRNAVALRADFDLPNTKELSTKGNWDFGAALTLVTTPNAPSGRAYTRRQLAGLCEAQGGVVVLDEAYVDFGNENALELALRYPHVLVARTFSKAYSLCFQRVGYFVGHPELIGALTKIRDSYNVNGLGQVAALATLESMSYYRANLRKIVMTREWLERELTKLGFSVFPSATNFLFARPPGMAAERWLAELRARKVLVRWFRDPAVSAYLRITVGTDAEAKAMVNAVRGILQR